MNSYWSQPNSRSAYRMPLEQKFNACTAGSRGGCAPRLARTFSSRTWGEKRLRWISREFSADTRKAESHAGFLTNFPRNGRAVSKRFYNVFGYCRCDTCLSALERTWSIAYCQGYFLCVLYAVRCLWSKLFAVSLSSRNLLE